ncbi:MAG: hypothetical protein C0179_04405 [Fervidicoccus sp.]|nr:MAG: hypothetical protein C0179_04405 [Fervidicoccus sp.]
MGKRDGGYSMGKRRKVKKTKEMTPKELLDEITKVVDSALYWMDKEWTEYVNNPNLDPPLFYDVSIEVLTEVCRHIVGEEDEEKINKCFEVADDIVDNLENKYNEPFVEAWIKIYYNVNEKIFEELVETLKQMPKNAFEKDEIEREIEEALGL